MDKEGIQDLLAEISGGASDTKEIHGWVSTHCPLAPWTHEKGTDRNMSFGVKIKEDGASIYNCFTCKSKGTLPMLLDRLSYYSGEDYSGLSSDVLDDELLGAPPPSWERRSRSTKLLKLGAPVSDEFLDIFELALGHEYLKFREVGDDTVSDLGICVDPDDKGQERILFPVYSVDSKFYGYHGRAVEDGVDPKSRDYFGLPKRALLMGADLINPRKDKFVALVEGPMDFVRLYIYDVPAVAALHSTLTQEQASILKGLGLPIYVFFDDDKAGKEGVEVVKKMLVKHVPVFTVRYPKENTVVDGNTGRLRPPADPDELLYYQYSKMIQTASLC